MLFSISGVELIAISPVAQCRRPSLAYAAKPLEFYPRPCSSSPRPTDAPASISPCWRGTKHIYLFFSSHGIFLQRCLSLYLHLNTEICDGVACRQRTPSGCWMGSWLLCRWARRAAGTVPSGSLALVCLFPTPLTLLWAAVAAGLAEPGRALRLRRLVAADAAGGTAAWRCCWFGWLAGSWHRGFLRFTAAARAPPWFSSFSSNLRRCWLPSFLAVRSGDSEHFSANCALASTCSSANTATCAYLQHWRGICPAPRCSPGATPAFRRRRRFGRVS